jgi:Icc protein
MQASILQITDCHLGDEYRGVDSWGRLRAVVRRIRRDHARAALVLATGDIAQDGRPSTYRAFIDEVVALGDRLAWVPGNHDDPAAMATAGAAAGVAGRRVRLDNWELLLLNSRCTGREAGELAAAELLWLQACLGDSAADHLLVALHHPPEDLGTPWLDALRLVNGEALLDSLATSRRVRGVVFGHVHQEVDYVRHGLRFLGSPATSVQFRPGPGDFALDDRPPGCRRLRLRPDGGIDTSVAWLADS